MANFNPSEYAREKGYTKYFQKGGQWYANFNGRWVKTKSKEEARQMSGVAFGVETADLRTQAIEYLKSLGYSEPDESEIQAAMKEISEGKAVTPPTSPTTPPPVVPDETTSTGNEILDQTLQILTQYLDKLDQRGQMINPAVEVTPEQMADFLAQAQSEIDPYYSGQLKLARENLLFSAGYTKDEVLKAEAELERKYGIGVRQLGERAAETGFLYGGRRRLAERELAEETQADIERTRRALGYETGVAAREFARRWGTEELPTLEIGAMPRAMAGRRKFGVGAETTPLFQLRPDIYQGLIGEQEFARKTAVRQRQAELEEAWRTKEEAKKLREITL